tara:strand:+ start:1260 stop:3017 length:1758 start_codon:yes stop_codon:yes gene_type:complete
MKYFLVSLCLVVLGVSILVINLLLQEMSEPSADSSINNNIDEIFVPDPIVTITPLVLDNFGNIKTQEVDEIEHKSILENLKACKLQVNQSNKSDQDDLNVIQKIFIEISKNIGRVDGYPLKEDSTTFTEEYLWVMDLNGENLLNLSFNAGIKQTSIISGHQNIHSNDHSQIAFLGPAIPKQSATSLSNDLIFSFVDFEFQIHTYEYLVIIDMVGNEKKILFDENWRALSHEFFWSEDDTLIYTLLHNYNTGVLNFVSINLSSEEVTVISQLKNNLIDLTKLIQAPTMSTDGKYVALIFENQLRIFDIFSFDMITKLDFPNPISMSSNLKTLWNPQKSIFTFYLNDDLYVFDINSSCYNNITEIIHSEIYPDETQTKSSKFGFTDIADNKSRPVLAEWSRDGSKILITYEHVSKIYSPGYFLFDINNGSVTELNFKANDVILNNDGSEILFITDEGLNKFDTQNGSVIEIDNTNSIYQFSNLVFSSNQSKIIYLVRLLSDVTESNEIMAQILSESNLDVSMYDLRGTEDFHIVSLDTNTNVKKILLKLSDTGMRPECIQGSISICEGSSAIIDIIPSNRYSLPLLD